MRYKEGDGQASGLEDCDDVAHERLEVRERVVVRGRGRRRVVVVVGRGGERGGRERDVGLERGVRVGGFGRDVDGPVAFAQRGWGGGDSRGGGRRRRGGGRVGGSDG
jgi:hypothetical protein